MATAMMRFCLVCGREWGPGYIMCCMEGGLIAMSVEGVFKKTNRYFTLDGQALTAGQLDEMRHAAAARHAAQLEERRHVEASRLAEQAASDTKIAEERAAERARQAAIEAATPTERPTKPIVLRGVPAPADQAQILHIFVVVSHPKQHDAAEIMRDFVPAFVPDYHSLKLPPDGKVAAVWITGDADSYDLHGACTKAFGITDPSRYLSRTIKARLATKGAMGTARCMIIYRA